MSFLHIFFSYCVPYRLLTVDYNQDSFIPFKELLMFTKCFFIVIAYYQSGKKEPACEYPGESRAVCLYV